MGGGIGMGNTCKPMAVLFQCMTKFTTNKKKNKILSIFLMLYNISLQLILLTQESEFASVLLFQKMFGSSVHCCVPSA